MVVHNGCIFSPLGGEGGVEVDTGLITLRIIFQPIGALPPENSASFLQIYFTLFPVYEVLSQFIISFEDVIQNDYMIYDIVDLLFYISFHIMIYKLYPEII